MKIKQCVAMGLAATLVMGTSVFAAATPHYVNSIGSEDMNDSDGTHVDAEGKQNVGFDETQDKKTEYYDSTTDGALNHVIEADAVRSCEVYVTQASTFSVIIPKTIILTGDKDATNGNIGTYVVTAKGNISADETINVVPETSFQMTQKNKTGSINATVTQPITAFKVKEFNGDYDNQKVKLGVDTTEDKDVDDGNGGTTTIKTLVGTTTTGTVEVFDLTAGSWEGTFNFDIELNTTTPVVAEQLSV